MLVRSMYALIFGGMVAYVAQGLFRDGWVSAAFGAVTVTGCAVWNLRRATVPRDRRPGRTGTRFSRFLLTRTGLVAVLAVLALCAALVIAIGDDDCLDGLRREVPYAPPHELVAAQARARGRGARDGITEPTAEAQVAQGEGESHGEFALSTVALAQPCRRSGRIRAPEPRDRAPTPLQQRPPGASRPPRARSPWHGFGTAREPSRPPEARGRIG
ncbi:hypothetical protein ACFV9W_18505 [Streptomyces sp. NPDC059897]|uniref:hypothetical protein n=1 Tax=Streptomyces sp. NPDC059897 TaxID=3346994 RepID=UPI003660553B